MFRELALPALLLGMIALPLQAAPAPFRSGEGPVSFRTFEDDQGGFYLAWTEQAPDRSLAFRAQHMNAEGHSLWDAPGLLISSRTSSAEDWSGLADGKGGLTLFWDEPDGVRAQRFQSDGSRLRPGNSVLMSTSTAI